MSLTCRPTRSRPPRWQQALEREGVETLFAYPGGASMEIHQALTRSDTIRNILCRHEQVRWRALLATRLMCRTACLTWLCPCAVCLLRHHSQPVVRLVACWWLVLVRCWLCWLLHTTSVCLWLLLHSACCWSSPDLALLTLLPCVASNGRRARSLPLRATPR